MADEMRRSLNSNWLFLLACTMLVLAGHLLLALAPVADPTVIQNSRSVLLPNAAGVFPEPQDLYMFVGVTLAGCLILIGVATIVRSSDNEKGSSSFVFLASRLSRWPFSYLRDRSTIRE